MLQNMQLNKKNILKGRSWVQKISMEIEEMQATVKTVENSDSSAMGVGSTLLLALSGSVEGVSLGLRRRGTRKNAPRSWRNGEEAGMSVSQERDTAAGEVRAKDLEEFVNQFILYLIQILVVNHL